MPWMTVCAVGLATAGLLVLGWLGCRLWLDVRRLAAEVDTAARAFATAAGDLERSTAPLLDALAAASAGDGH